MARTFEVISPYDGATLRLSEYDKDYFIAELIGANLQAKARVDTYMSVRSLATLFEEMAAGWRGWTGKKAWNSLEYELQLSAEMDRTGHVTLTVALTEGTPRVWTAIYDIVLESGQLEALSRAAQAFESAILNKA